MLPSANGRTDKSDVDKMLDELDAITTAWINGYSQGFSHGVNAHMADLEAAATHRVAAEIVTRMAGYPERDRDADRVAGQRRADKFGQPVMKAGAA